MEYIVAICSSKEKYYKSPDEYLGTLAFKATYFQMLVFIVSLVRIVNKNILEKHLGTFTFA